VSTRTFAVVAATCVVVAARLLASSALLDSPALAVAGLAPLLILALASWWYRWGSLTGTHGGATARAARFHGVALLAAAVAGFINGKFGLGALLLVGALALGASAWWAQRRRD
jgi:hypothetical protein